MTRFDDWFSGMGRPALINGHGESVTYTAPGASSGTTVTGVVHRGERGEEEAADGVVEQQVAAVVVATGSGGIGSPSIGATVRFDSADWRVVAYEQTAGGLATLTVRRVGSTEKNVGNRMRRTLRRW